MIQSGHKSAYVTRAQLSWPDRIIIITRILQNLEKYAIKWFVKWVCDQGRGLRLFVFLPWKQHYAQVWFYQRLSLAVTNNAGLALKSHFSVKTTKSNNMPSKMWVMITYPFPNLTIGPLKFAYRLAISSHTL